MSDATPLFEARSVSKRFGDFLANDDVSLRLRSGSIHALLGENGAGKSTLVKMMYGALQPSAGELLFEGRPTVIANPAEARALGIGMVFQHFSLFDALTVTENIALALPGDTALAGLSERVGAVAEEYGLTLEPKALVADLSVGERQRIEVVRCLLQQPQVLIMDEPTAVLTPQEADQLFETLRRVAGEGCAVLYISHRLEEVQALCDHATILRHGKVVAEVDPKQETAGSLARLMVGEEVDAVRSDRDFNPGAPRLEVRNLSAPANGPFGVDLDDISLEVRSGEVVAIAGVAGNGQGELFEFLSGERRASTASAIRMAGHDCGREGVSARRRLGAAFVPEERLGHAAVPELGLADNVVLTRHASDTGLSRIGFLRRGLAHSMLERIRAQFDVRADKKNPPANALSGGNLQKFVVGRELDREPKLLVVSQPTWGVDAGAAAAIRQALIRLARNSAAVLVISQDLDEVLVIADRIAVINRGRLSRLYAVDAIDREQIGLLMGGAAVADASTPTVVASQ
ncbi:MAG: ABC transporter ATP-binding protein [Pseudomonadota bacterium]